MNPFGWILSGTRTSRSATRAARLGVLVILGSLVTGALFGVGTAGARPARLLLPNLQPVAPTEIIGPGTEVMPTLGVDAPLIVDGCFTDERVRKGAARCLRYDGKVANVGYGPFELLYVADAHAGLASATQRIYRKDGSYKDRFATQSEFHPTHAHFHVRDFYTARLWKATTRGKKLGKKPVAMGDKNGFCPEDSTYVGPAPSSPDRYSCLTDEESSASPASLQVVGISAGWMDVYTASLPDQFVEISGVADGSYVLEIELDPNNVFKESVETDNKACTLLQLAGQDAHPLRTVAC